MKNTNQKKLETNKDIQKISNINDNSEESTIINDKNSKDFKINFFLNKLLNFIKQNPKKTLIICISIFALIVAAKIFNAVTDKTKLNWVKNEDYKINVIPTSGSLNLIVEAYDEDNNKIKEIDFNASDGKTKVNGTKVKWILPSKEGKYTISAKTPSGKKIKKTIEVKKISGLEEKKSLGTVYKIDISDDYDLDGLKNEDEKKYGTNERVKDTDHDGINDYEEINQTKTNPLKIDTDGDGLNDLDEIELKFDPLKVDSKADGIKDGERELTYNTNYNDEVSLKINGKGNIASTTTIDIFENSSFSNIKGISNRVYVFHTDSKMKNAEVEIKYDISDINKKGLNENNLILYYFNEETKEFEPQKTELNTDNKTVKATLTHFSKYVLGDSTVTSESNNSNIMFVIDNSVSMFSEKQMQDAGYVSNTATGNDTEFKRLSLSINMIDKLTGKYKFGVAEFSGNYVNIEKFTSEKGKVIDSIETLKHEWRSNMSGTNIISALENGIKEFNNSDEINYLILLTDGKNTEGTFTSSIQNEIIKKANEKKIKICTIGIGKVDGFELKNISQQTGCDFYSASNSSILDDIYNKIGADINYNLVDTNEDNKIDGTILADSGFIVTRDGFSFKNYSSKQSLNGHCYGLATYAMLYYTKKLPLKLDSINTSTGVIVGKTEFSSSGYDLNGTYFSNYKNLYDYQFKDSALKIFMSGKVPSDYRYQDKENNWKVRSRYLEIFDRSGFHKYMDNKTERLCVNIDSDNFKRNVNKDDRELLNAIWRLYVLQLEDEEVSFTSDPDDAYNTLYESLKNGIPIVLNLTYKVGDDEVENHSVNAVRLIQRNDDPNDLEIEIYDNNYPGKPKYISLQRYKMEHFIVNSTTMSNKYDYVMVYDNKMLYTDDFFNTNGIGVTVSKLKIK